MKADVGWCSVLFLVSLMSLAGCQQQMANQPHYRRPFESSAEFPDGRSARPVVPDTVARGQLRTDSHLYRGKEGEEFVDTFPFEITSTVLERGRERYNIFCAVCHDRRGTGDGKIVQRGFTRPPSFHTDLSRGLQLRGSELPLREAPVGYYFDVITSGFGAMPDYAAQISPSDRWAIIAYVRALQLSQRIPLSELPPKDQEAARKELGDKP